MRFRFPSFGAILNDVSAKWQCRPAIYGVDSERAAESLATKFHRDANRGSPIPGAKPR